MAAIEGLCWKKLLQGRTGSEACLIEVAGGTGCFYLAFLLASDRHPYRFRMIGNELVGFLGLFGHWFFSADRGFLT